MYILDSPKVGKVCFVLPPRTGTRSIESALKRKRASCQDGRHRIVEGSLRSCQLVVAAIRHPLEILLSWFSYDNKGEECFRRYVEREALSGGNRYLAESTLPHADRATEFLRYEFGVRNEYNRVMEQIGLEPDPNFEHIGKTGAGELDVLSYYPDDLLEQVKKKYRKDFVGFHYA